MEDGRWSMMVVESRRVHSDVFVGNVTFWRIIIERPLDKNYGAGLGFWGGVSISLPYYEP